VSDAAFGRRQVFFSPRGPKLSTVSVTYPSLLFLSPMIERPGKPPRPCRSTTVDEGSGLSGRLR